MEKINRREALKVLSGVTALGTSVKDAHATVVFNECVGKDNNERCIENILPNEQKVFADRFGVLEMTNKTNSGHITEIKLNLTRIKHLNKGQAIEVMSVLNNLSKNRVQIYFDGDNIEMLEQKSGVYFQGRALHNIKPTQDFYKFTAMAGLISFGYSIFGYVISDKLSRRQALAGLAGIGLTAWSVFMSPEFGSLDKNLNILIIR